MDNYKKIKEELLSEGAAITSNLQLITIDLMKLVNQGKIVSINFQNSPSDSMISTGFIRISLDINKKSGTGKYVQLGIFDDMQDEPNFSLLSKDIQEKLSDINDYLRFINTHLSQDIPAIENSYYSLQSYMKTAGFKDENVRILPDFMTDILGPDLFPATYNASMEKSDGSFRAIKPK